MPVRNSIDPNTKMNHSEKHNTNILGGRPCGLWELVRQSA